MSVRIQHNSVYAGRFKLKLIGSLLRKILCIDYTSLITKLFELNQIAEFESFDFIFF